MQVNDSLWIEEGQEDSEYINYNSILVEVSLNEDDPRPININLDESCSYSLAGAKSLVRFINKMIKIAETEQLPK